MPVTLPVGSDAAAAKGRVTLAAGGGADVRSQGMPDASFLIMMQAFTSATQQPSTDSEPGMVALQHQQRSVPPRAKANAEDGTDAAAVMALSMQPPNLPLQLQQATQQAGQTTPESPQTSCEDLNASAASDDESSTTNEQNQRALAAPSGSAAVPESPNAGLLEGGIPNTLLPPSFAPLVADALEHATMYAPGQTPSRDPHQSTVQAEVAAYRSTKADTASAVVQPSAQPITPVVEALQNSARSTKSLSVAPAAKNESQNVDPAPAMSTMLKDGDSLATASGLSRMQGGAPSDAATGVEFTGASIAPAVQLASVGNAMLSGNDSRQQASDERKEPRSNAASSLAATVSPVSFGLGSWLSSAHGDGTPPLHHTASTQPLTGSDGMSQLNQERVSADSSARRLNDALRSDMTFGIHTDAFGRVDIQASLHGDQLTSQISLEQAHLHASTLAAHLPSLELQLGDKYQVTASVTVQGQSGSAMAGNSQSQHDRQSQTRSGGTSAGTTNTSILTDRSTPVWASPPSTLPYSPERLDVTI